MTKVFISHSNLDKTFVNQLINRLKNDGIKEWDWDDKMHVGDNINEKITEAINNTDYFIVVLSKNSAKSEWVNFELSLTRIKEISKQQNIILPVLIEDCEIPFDLKGRFFADFRSSFEDGYKKLISGLKTDTAKQFTITDRQAEKFSVDLYEFEIKNLQEAYSIGNLTLFCGSGISYDAKIPTWNTLLKSLLKEANLNREDVPDIDIRLADIFHKRNISPIIIAQYLKVMLGDKFTSTVRNTLYKECIDESKIIDSISELCRQKRNRNSLKAIITFNFDDLIEEKLKKEKIDFKAIYSEGEKFRDEEIPIYHPHGFLPREETLTPKNQIVFSEDAYHTQFIDPYIWSNLVQLNHFYNSICLFIGISLTDPNMRRLLDISTRRNGKGEKNHYIIKKRYTTEQFFPKKEQVKDDDKKLIQIIESIEEEDTRNLGFNVIWVNEYSEIPIVLNEIGNKNLQQARRHSATKAIK